MVLTPDAALTEVLGRGLYDAVVIPGGEQAANTMSQVKLLPVETIEGVSSGRTAPGTAYVSDMTTSGRGTIYKYKMK
jgi:hypothetical protein